MKNKNFHVSSNKNLNIWKVSNAGQIISTHKTQKEAIESAKGEVGLLTLFSL